MGSPLVGTIAPGGGGAGAAVFYDEGRVGAKAPVYASWATALAAAQKLVEKTSGPVDLFILHENDTPSLPAGTHALGRKIRLRAAPAPAIDMPIPLAIAGGAVLQDASLLEGLVFQGNLTTALLTSSAGPLEVTFTRCGHADLGNSAAFAALGSGTNRFRFEAGSSFLFDAAPFATLLDGKNVDAFVEGFSQLNAEAFAGAAGALAIHVDGSSVVEAPAGFSGALTRRDAATRAWRAVGVAGTHQTLNTSWTTIGALHLDPGLLAAPPASTREFRLHADLEVVEASAGTVTAELRLVDASLAVVGSVSTTLGGASAFPQHRASSALTAGAGAGQVRPTATTYLVQLRRQGGAGSDLVLCHGAHLEATWS